MRLSGSGIQLDPSLKHRHGHMGWTMACGAARITSDLIAGRKVEIDLEGMTPW